MKVRLGYVAISKTLENVTSSHTITYTQYKKLDEQDKKKELENILKKNLNDLDKIITYNLKNSIHFFRLSSKIVPLATHPDVLFNFNQLFNYYFHKIGKKINQGQMRVDTHPDQFCVLNSMNHKIVADSFLILDYHRQLLKKLKIKKPLIILHLGSSAGGKKRAMSRFINNFLKLDEEVQKMIALENDDKTFLAEDVLMVCEKLKIPMIFDYHHYFCHHDQNLDLLWERILKTWKMDIPKIHFSSPKNLTKKMIRCHNDYIDSQSFINFIEIIKKYNHDIDIMIEAKGKDEALFKLVRELKYLTNYNFIDETTFIVEK